MRDRIQELRRVRASELIPHPKNWRLHRPAQHSALRCMLEGIGYADALVARQTAEGLLQLIDGHLRAELTPDAVVPVLIVDLDEEEADKLLLTHDPLAAMAEADQAALSALLSEVELDNAALETSLFDLASKSELTAESTAPLENEEPSLPQLFHVVVACDNEDHQREVYTRLKDEGLTCKLIHF